MEIAILSIPYPKDVLHFDGDECDAEPSLVRYSLQSIRTMAEGPPRPGVTTPTTRTAKIVIIGSASTGASIYHDLSLGIAINSDLNASQARHP